MTRRGGESSSPLEEPGRNRDVVLVVAAVLLTVLVWHGYNDHRALHRNIRLWNQYGPQIERVFQTQEVP